MCPCYLVQDEWSPRVSLAGVSSSLCKACNNNCADFNHPLTLQPAHQRIDGEKLVTKLLPLTGTEEGIFVYLLLPVVAVEPILAFVAAYHLKRRYLRIEQNLVGDYIYTVLFHLQMSFEHVNHLNFDFLKLAWSRGLSVCCSSPTNHRCPRPNELLHRRWEADLIKVCLMDLFVLVLTQDISLGDHHSSLLWSKKLLVTGMMCCL